MKTPQTKKTTPKKREVKGWAIVPIVSGKKFDPESDIYHSKRAIHLAIEGLEIAVPCTISYSLPKKQK